MKKNGLVETLVVNKRTGNLVSGHQRIDLLDALEGSQDYQLTVAMIDVDAKQEKELNLFLNNPATQGEYNIEMLRTHFKDIDFGEAGFELADISYFRAEESIDEDAENVNEGEQAVESDIADILADKEAKRAHVKEVKEQMKQDATEMGEKFFVVTFRSVLEKQEFLMKYGFLEDEKYVDGYTLETIMKKK
jgi:hypothetical protein